MGLRFKTKPAPAPVALEDDGEESPEEFEERVYDALMTAARGSSARLRNDLGSCVMLGTRFAAAPENVRQAIAEFIDLAGL